MELSWKNVFNSELADFLWGHIDKAYDQAKASGYKYFTWNGMVYSVETKEATGIEVENLK